MILLPGCPCCGGGATPCDCPGSVNIGGNAQLLTFDVLIFGSPYATCDLCMIDAIGGTLQRTAGSVCNYYGTFSLTSCLGVLCEVIVYFDLSNFPDCECSTTGDYCDYTITGWQKSAGSPNITISSVVTGGFC